MIKRRGGAIVDRDDPRDYAAGAILPATSTALPSLVDYRSAWGIPGDQGDTNSCTGWALTRSATLLLRLQGLTAPKFSPLFSYWFGRWRDLDDPDDVLTDTGARPREVTLAAVKYGLCVEDAWPFIESAVNAAPSFNALRSGITHRVRAFYRVMSSTADRPFACRRALANGMPVVITLAIDEGLDVMGSTSELGLPYGYLRGLHRVALVGYRPGAFLVANSWGTSWGFGGFAWVSDDRIAHPSTRDMEVIQVLES